MNNDIDARLKAQEAEQALLGALLINPDALRGLNLEAGDVADLRNREIFAAMQRLAARHESLDYLTLAEELRGRGKLAEVGGEAYLLKLLEATPSSLHANEYAEIISDRARRRRIVGAASELVNAAYSSQGDLDEAVARALTTITAGAGGKDGATPIADVLAALLDAVEEAAHHPQDIFGIPTGLAGFDRITSGLQRSEVFMLSGEPGIGKSFLAFQLAVGAAAGSNGIQGTPGAVFELEMSSMATVRRAVSVRSQVRARVLRSGRLEDGDWSRIMGAVEQMSRLPIFISDRTDWTTTGLKAECARLKTFGIGWIVIDYLALLKDLPQADETERSAAVSDRVHDIAKDLDLAVIAVHDMTKAGMTGHVSGQAGLSGSRRVSYNADMTAFLRATDDGEVFNLEWAKFREDSPDRILPLRRVPGFPAFAEVSRAA